MDNIDYRADELANVVIYMNGLYSRLQEKYNELACAVAWEREFDEALVWLVQTGRYPRDMAGKNDLANERDCARAEVDKLITSR